MFVNPNSGGTNIDMTDPDRLIGYMPLKNSPAINAGQKLNNNGGKDYVGWFSLGPDYLLGEEFDLKFIAQFM